MIESELGGNPCYRLAGAFLDRRSEPLLAISLVRVGN
jgi:hypothetical protein